MSVEPYTPTAGDTALAYTLFKVGQDRSNVVNEANGKGTSARNLDQSGEATRSGWAAVAEHVARHYVRRTDAPDLLVKAGAGALRGRALDIFTTDAEREEITRAVLQAAGIL